MKPGDIIRPNRGSHRILYRDEMFSEDDGGYHDVREGEVIIVVGVFASRCKTTKNRGNVDKVLLLLSSCGAVGFNWIDDDSPERWRIVS